jgi:hypothetical protein
VGRRPVSSSGGLEWCHRSDSQPSCAVPARA